ncbi:hypothetical protein [Bacillus phage Anath]|uniref:Uncharacterized protein n=1 Tax=Bacillus phage Anath TaxID=2108114 RepID=A0A2P1JUK7_9CAUD|nr:hypothetical protein [Bacillus phage Anath]
MGVSTDFINGLKTQVANLKDLQTMNRNRIGLADAELAEAKRIRDEKAFKEQREIDTYQKEIDNLEFTIGLLEAQLPKDEGTTPPTSPPPTTPTE